MFKDVLRSILVLDSVGQKLFYFTSGPDIKMLAAKTQLSNVFLKRAIPISKVFQYIRGG